MATTLADFIALVRSRHPAFEKRMVPDKTLADFATTEQRRVLTLALSRDRQFLAQSMSIAVALSSANAPGTVGAGTSGGLPADLSDEGSLTTVEQTTGSAATLETDDVAVLVSDTAVTSATATSLTATGTAWATNAYAGTQVVITAGLGYGQPPRTITTNTSGTLHWTDAWATVPDSTSTFRIVEGTTTVDRTVGVVTALPGITTRNAYLVRLNASGVPFLDVANPLTVSTETGVPLPAFHSVLGGTVRQTSNPANAVPLSFVAYGERLSPRAWPAAYLLNQTLYLCGASSDWAAVGSIDVQYVPVPPAFTALADYFLLPDSAVQVLVARAALFAASRLDGLPGAPKADGGPLAAEAALAEREFVSTLSLTSRARISRMRPYSY